MKEFLDSLGKALAQTSAASKVVVALVGLAVLLAVGVAGVVANRPDYSPAFTGLSDPERATVSKALAEAGISFEASQPPGPYTVYVDEDDRAAAFIAAYGGGALDRPIKGILTDPGISSVFMGDAERMQVVNKRAWEEVEGMLEQLDFVQSATVRAAPVERSVFRAEEDPTTASVALTTRNKTPLTRDQAMSVSRLASRALGIPETNLVISDQSGKSPYDPAAEAENEPSKNLLALKMDYDRRTAAAVNALLDGILGPNRARATVNSTWDYEQVATFTETTTKGGIVRESKNTSESPVGGAQGAGGVPGLGNSLADPNAAGSTTPAASAQPEVATTSQEEKEYQPSRQTKQSVRSHEVLVRQSIAVYIDASVPEEVAAQLEANIKASCGFSEERDAFSRAMLPFFQPEESGEDAAAPEESGGAPNPMVERLLRRGVEILTALVFIVLLLKSLKSARATAALSAKASEESERAASSEELDPELLARAQVEELLKADPERVGQILASWAREDQTAGAA